MLSWFKKIELKSEKSRLGLLLNLNELFFRDVLETFHFQVNRNCNKTLFELLLNRVRSASYG